MNTPLIALSSPAPDFELTDIHGNLIRLSSFQNKQPVILAFLRGFL
ncbi:MAG: redoxin domain-containing protein [Anaerolineales bacterium]|nr:redoxin domain-containing protein [Anaerolineales bacterium]